MSTGHSLPGAPGWLVLCLWLAGTASSDIATPPPAEHQVKAAFMLHFAKLVTSPGWPEPRLPQMLCVGYSELEQARRTLEAVRGRPVLTVGEANGFARVGGIVGFRVTPDGRVAFDVNVAQAERSGLKLSSQLLRVARVVETRP